MSTINANTLFQNITFDEIELKLMTILLNNEDKLIYDRHLYNLLLDKFRYQSGFIDPNLKNKYFVVLRNLDANENVKVFKNNNIYKIVYTTKPELYNREMIPYEDNTYISPEKNIDVCHYSPSEVYRYIDSSLSEEFSKERSYVDIENGNTIYHDLVRECTVDILTKMFNTKSMNINVLNKNGLTPIDYINDISVARLFIKELNEQLKTVSKQIENINNNKKISEEVLNEEIDQKILLKIRQQLSRDRLEQYFGAFFITILLSLLSYLFKLFI